MNTSQYVEYSKKGAIGGVALFAFGALGSGITSALGMQLPPRFEGAFLYMLILGFVAVFVSILTAGVLPLALE